MKFIDLDAQYVAYKTEIDSAIAKVLQSGQFIMGPEVQECERILSEYTGAEYSLTCSSGTDALLIAMMALDIGPGDEVITSPFSFWAAVEMILLLGAKPVFVDIEDQTYNLDAKLLEKKISKKTKAIIPVSIFGQIGEMDEYLTIGKKHNIPIIEDAAQSFGAEYRGKKSCNLAYISTTSFFPAKPLGCYGDGGAIFTNDKAIAEKMMLIRNHGQRKRYDHVCVGINGRFDTIQAAILSVKLKYFKEDVQARQKIAQRYFDGLSPLKNELVLPFVHQDRLSVFAQFCVRSKKRDQLIDFLGHEKIPTSIHYPSSILKQDCVKSYGIVDDCPVTDKVCNEIVALPFGPFLTTSDQDRVISTISKFWL